MNGATDQSPIRALLATLNLGGRVAVSPNEFASLFGKHKSWAYRAIYEGKVSAVSSMGKLLIPMTEVERILASAEPYDPKPQKAKETAVEAAPA